jgi:hypothetical protein
MQRCLWCLALVVILPFSFSISAIRCAARRPRVIVTSPRRTHIRHLVRSGASEGRLDQFLPDRGQPSAAASTFSTIGPAASAPVSLHEIPA